MSFFNTIKTKFLVFSFFILFIFPAYTFCQNEADNSINYSAHSTDVLGKKYYAKWQKTKKNKADLDSANANFIKSYQFKSKELKFDYACELARLLVKNNEQSVLIKDWYLRAFSSYDSKSVDAEKPLSEIQKVVEKYSIIYEFINVYADVYGKCEDAIEILREHKTDFYFNYIQKKGKETGYDKMWTNLENKDYMIYSTCKEK
ncbi:MAG: hypothetical protein A3K10_04415 [Bacteroidetes bacterium RIFCSPLOWO2_12_FULL_31_6]|nr:MAG: hypothetical protein A3K10_04415 [Bacteroidetes bacterium RIFCSPLOWO2_12_FULL_31_6]